MSSKTKKPPTKTQAPLQEPELVARIREALETLALNQTAKRFEELLGAPPADQSRLEWLWALLQPQAQTRVESRLERRIREARLPERKTLETLNACVANLRVRYTTNAAMLRALNASLADGTLEEALRPYTTPELLIIDEVGLEQVERTIACRAGLMQKVLLPRYEKRSTIITSNIPWDAWGDYLQDHLGAGALVDRLLHHSHVIVVNGPSWRDHQHKLQVKEEAARRPKAAPAQKPASKPSK